MTRVVCVSESIYWDVLSRGRYYQVLQTDTKRGLVQVEIENSRPRWFPTFCFNFDTGAAPVMTRFELHGILQPDQLHPVQVDITLSTGEVRWCLFITPVALAQSGHHIEDTEIPFHYGNRNLIVAGELSEELIGKMLRFMDKKGTLIECSLPVLT